jgi:ribosomal protein L12E/L44/L45/RPP1/RPP2
VKIEAYWPKLFAKALHGKDISSFFNFGGAVASGPVAAESAKGAKTSAPADKKADDKGAKK